jgi:hypothetical protein
VIFPVFFPLLSGKLHAETGSHADACADTLGIFPQIVLVSGRYPREHGRVSRSAESLSESYFIEASAIRRSVSGPRKYFPRPFGSCQQGSLIFNRWRATVPHQRGFGPVQKPQQPRDILLAFSPRARVLQLLGDELIGSARLAASNSSRTPMMRMPTLPLSRWICPRKTRLPSPSRTTDRA